MKSIPLINRQAIFLVFLAAAISGVYVYRCITVPYHWDPRNSGATYHTITAYNFYKYNLIGIWRDQGLCFENYHIKKTGGRKTKLNMHPVSDTPWVGVFTGLLWKLLGRASVFDEMILHIVFFSLFMLIVYQTCYFLFQTRMHAFCSSLALLLFFPLPYHNIATRKDIWIYYGIVVLLYVMLHFSRYKNKKILLLGAIFFAFLQSMRMQSFGVLVMLTIVFLGWFLFDQRQYAYVPKMLIYIWITNILLCWGPYVIFNKIMYNRYTSGLKGHLLLQSLGEIPNKWNAAVDDGWVAKYVSSKYPQVADQYRYHGFDDKAQVLFWEMFWEDPLHYVWCVLYRIKRLIFINLSWGHTNKHLYQGSDSFIARLKKACRNWRVAFDFFPRILYVRMFLLFGYLGMFLAWMRRRYDLLSILVLGVLFPVGYTLLLHIEDRFVVVFFWVFPLFASYFCVELYAILKAHKEQLQNRITSQLNIFQR